MVIIDEKTGEKHAYCDKCSEEITEQVYIFDTGDIFCEECFSHCAKEKSVEEYLEKFQ